ncbi:GIY-YIG nuclease family protein [Streptacidiphilus carbonis]|uniref:GIY-YIG nuclease family protein n=1 Tax=Streptacidiphilus carbonis TaxID=105422 RepID=UPI000693A2D1|nr:GIY-YIG nuclease family protein [Streptacidiphilus carbonis]
MTQRSTSGEMINRTNDEEVALYRFFDREGQVLYIGICLEPAKRWYSHADRSWWRNVTSYKVTWYPSRSEAALAEGKAIAAERPKHNVVFNRGRKRACGSPVLTGIVLNGYGGRRFSALELALESGFSTTSAHNTLRALVAAGRAEIVGAPKWSEARYYSLVAADPPAE